MQSKDVHLVYYDDGILKAYKQSFTNWVNLEKSSVIPEVILAEENEGKVHDVIKSTKKN